ncbi:MAG: phosphatidylserine decarboxylase family protein [Rhodothermales bacterium]
MIAKEGYFTIAWAGLLVVAVLFLTRDLSLIPRVILIVLAIDVFTLIVFFFRDPDRALPSSENPENVIVAPADGMVVAVSEVADIPYIGGHGSQLSIFLSIFDVHVNRIPASGVIERAMYIPGKYLVAWHPKSSELNERAEFVLKHPSGMRVLFRQIAGLIARRVVYHIDEGSKVTAGERFGIMKFGSRMDVVVPEGVAFMVAKGDRVKGGVTVLARLDHSERDSPGAQ